MWVLVVSDEITQTVHVYGDSWSSQEEGIQGARDFIKNADDLIDLSTLRLTVVQIEKI